MKKNHFVTALLLLPLSILSPSCNTSDAARPISSDLGMFLGQIQVSDELFTKLRYLSNAKVSISRNGSDVNIKITGTPDFDREYTGNMTAEIPQNKSYVVSLKQQTKPNTKIVTGDLVIDGNALNIQVNVSNDNLNAIENGQIISLSGKIKMIGTSIIRQ